MDMPWGVSMLIDKAVASKLKHVLETVQPYPVVIYDRKGTIAAGPNGKRIGACHRGILRCLDGWPDQSADMPEHVRCITFKGAAVGAVELLGLSAEDAPYLTMAEAIVELLLERDTSFSSVGTIDPALQQALTTLVGVHPSDCTSLLHELSRNGVSLSVPRTTLLIQLSRVEKMTLKNNFREPIVDDRQFHHLMDHFFEQLPVYFSNENDFILPNPEKQSAFVLYADRSDTLDVNAIGIFNTCRELERLAARGQLLDMHAVIGTRCCTLADYERQYEQLEIRLSAGRLLRSDQHIILGPSVVLGSMVLYDSIDTRKKITAFVFNLACPRTFFGENLEKGILGFVGKRHAVKNEELGFGTKESLVTDAGALEIIFGTACKRTGITRIALAGIGLENIASQNESVLFTERIHAGRFRVGHQNHVARFNAFPAGHRRAVKGLPVFESVFGELMGRHGHVLFFAAGIGQTIINELDIVVFNHLQNVCGRGHD